MKRVWASLIIFLILIVGSAAGVNSTERIAKEMTGTVSEAKAAEEKGDSKTAYELSRKAGEDWKTHHAFLCTYMTHSRLEAIDQTLAALPALCSYGSADEFTAECDKSLAQFSYLTESEIPSIANIF
jgi:hypothetical protein